MKFLQMLKQPYFDEIDSQGGGEEIIQSAQPTETTEQQTTTSTEAVRIPYKFMDQSGEMALDEAQTYLQKGMNYERAVEKARQEARDSWIAEQGYTWNDKPITTEAEYKQALKEQELAEKVRQQYSNVPDEIVNKLIEFDRFREETQAEKQARLEQETQTKAEQERSESIRKQNQAFLQAFKEENGRGFDPDTDTIPNEVAVDVKNGLPLDYAYTKYLLNQKRLGAQTIQANQKNAQSSTGSAKGQGATGSNFISRETFEQNKHDQSWMSRNYETLRKSMNEWGR